MSGDLPAGNGACGAGGSLSLLPEGTYAVELFRDGENAARIAQDYVREEFLLAPGKIVRCEDVPRRRFRRPDNQTIAYGMRL